MRKNVLITGGSRGIGKALAHKFHTEHWNVTIFSSGNDNNPEQELWMYEQLDGRVCNIANEDEVKAACINLLDDYSRIDVLINNAGIYQPGGMLADSGDQFKRMMDVNLFGAYYCTKAIVPSMIENGGGVVVNMCSTASLLASGDKGQYHITKHALLGFSNCLREEVKDKNVRVISVLPGQTLTGSWNAEKVNTSKFLKPHDVASLVFDAVEISSYAVIEDLKILPVGGNV